MEDQLIYYSLYKNDWSATDQEKKFDLQKVERDNLCFYEHKGTTHHKIQLQFQEMSVKLGV